MHQPPPPDSRELLPPLLACLPTAFASPRPPPALLPLLSPVLRQRVSFLTSSGNPRSDGWLPLLSWDGERGAKLPQTVERMQLEPHPVSGELEMDDIRPAKFRRLDDETLHARLEVEQFEILPIYVWCETDEHGGTGPGWKLAELRTMDDIDDGLEWFETVSEANDAMPTRTLLTVPAESTNGDQKSSVGDSDDAAYWAAYDRTPGRTPALKRSPAPQSLSSFQPQNRQRSVSELDYFSRYGEEVQPAMDAHDPDEEEAETQKVEERNSSPRDSLLHPEPLRPEQQQQQQGRPASRPTGASLYPADTVAFPAYNDIPAPRPRSATSSHSSIEKLERRARAISEAQMSQMSHASDFAQTAIKQHISTDIKSLFRLARNSGIERVDFERIVKTELECLSLLEEGD